MVEPKCPECKIQGLEYIVSHDSVEESKGGDPWFNIVSCSGCGHVYGVFNKISHEPRTSIPLRLYNQD